MRAKKEIGTEVRKDCLGRAFSLALMGALMAAGGVFLATFATIEIPSLFWGGTLAVLAGVFMAGYFPTACLEEYILRLEELITSRQEREKEL